jgi:hypothetical protein
MSDAVLKFFTKTAVSAARSLLLSEVKGGVKSLIDKKRAKTIEDIHREMIKDLGYTTSHYVINKKTQEISYKSSAVFVHEWLTNSPLVVESIVRDEESGHLYIDGESITNAKKLDLIGRFIKSTNIKAASLSGHMDNALKLIDLSDFNASKFGKHFAGWKPETQSVIDGWIENTFGGVLASDPAYAKLLFRKWIVGTARRAMTPGTTFDGCLTFSGPGGVGKTAFFRNLLPEPFAGRTGEILCDVKNPQKFVESIKGKTIACFDELSVLEHPQSEQTFKQLLSTQNIDVRLAWAREPRRYALRQGFAATTNKEQFIPDEFLSRRLWTIQLNNTGRLNFEYLFANRENLWREAVYLAQQGESHILSYDEQRLVEERNKQFIIGK